MCQMFPKKTDYKDTLLIFEYKKEMDKKTSLTGIVSYLWSKELNVGSDEWQIVIFMLKKAGSFSSKDPSNISQRILNNVKSVTLP